MIDPNIKPTGCCDPFDPEPLNMGKVITRNLALIEKAGAKAAYQLMLTEEKSPWGSDIYIDVAKPVAGAQMATLSGTFLTKVFEGPYNNAGKWTAEMADYVAKKDKKMKKLYFSYTTCPKCAKAYGKNYVVLLALID